MRVALLLAAIGIYGLTAGEAAARSRETAVRLALGASGGEAFWSVVRPGAASLGVGLLIGLAAALAAARGMASLLHGVQPADPTTFVVVPALFSGVGVIAASLGAARILRADPAATLRMG